MRMFTPWHHDIGRYVMGVIRGFNAQVPSAFLFRRLLMKLRDADYSCQVAAATFLQFKGLGSAQTAMFMCLSEIGVFLTQAGFGRYKKRCMLACLGEAARKLTLLWL